MNDTKQNSYEKKRTAKMHKKRVQQQSWKKAIFELRVEKRKIVVEWQFSQ